MAHSIYTNEYVPHTVDVVSASSRPRSYQHYFITHPPLNLTFALSGSVRPAETCVHAKVFAPASPAPAREQPRCNSGACIFAGRGEIKQYRRLAQLAASSSGVILPSRL
eukprot:scaffold65831_cov78-Phaeocystis_antarctica.AAC.2